MKEQKKPSKYIEIYSNNRKLWIRLNEEALEKAIDICRASKKTETGGVITGFYSTSGITCTIESLYPPTIDSIHNRRTFLSGVKGLTNLFKALWVKQEYYIGEWHFHPRNPPFPSKQDRVQLRDIAEKEDFYCKFPLMLIIGQNKDGYCFSVTGYSSPFGYVEFLI